MRAGANGLRGVRIVHLMPTFKQCRDVHGELTEADLDPDGQWGFLNAKIDHTRWHISFPGGSWIQWFGTKEANRARGLRVDFVSMDEVDDIEPEVADAIARPWFSEPWSLKMELSGGTPRRGRYGLLYRNHRAGIETDPERRDPHRFSFHATYRDAGNVDQAYVARLRKQMEHEGALPVFEREWECSFDSAEGLVYGLFDEKLHVRRPAPNTRWNEVLVGVDHGWEDPGVFLVLGVLGSGRDAVVHVIEEVYERHQQESWWIEKAKGIRGRFPFAAWFGDPSRPDRIRAIADNAHVKFAPANNAIQDGVSAVADRLAPRPDPDDPETDPSKQRRAVRLFVDPSCVNTIAEFGAYRRKRDPRNSERILDDIEDHDNHAMDALRYVILSRFGVPEWRTHRSHSLPPS